MDEALRKAKREYERTGDAGPYVALMERLLAHDHKYPLRVQPEFTTVPCLICESPIEKESTLDEPWIRINPDRATYLSPVSLANPSNAVIVSCSGNYGSRLLDGDVIYFYLCDECVVRNSSKMFWRDTESRTARSHIEIRNARDHFEQAIGRQPMSPLQEYLDP